MSHDLPDNSVEKIEVPEVLREFMYKFGKFEATSEEVQKFKELVEGSFSVEELEAQWLSISSECEDVAREWLDATGERLAELDRLNVELWRKLAVYRTAINVKSGKNK